VSGNPKNLEGKLAAGQMLGRYEMLLPIAAGGMGNVWAARLKGTRGFRKLVAIKTVLHSVDDQKLERMLFQEATLASQIHHPNVIETIELGEHAGTLYLVMELVFGESLSFILREAMTRGGVPLPVAVNLVAQVCRGLSSAHNLSDAYGNLVGLVHRDISPSNVLVSYSGNVKIVDFGVATTAASAAPSGPEIQGKLSYLAPEQLRGETVDARVDVYATGLLLYLMTVQKHPFRSGSENDTIARILSAQPVTPPSAFVEDYPEALEAVVLRALEKRRERRYPSASALLEALEAAMPVALGPNGDRLTSEYLEQLLRPRMLERRATLRMAEELSEQSSARDSAPSVPAMVASHPPPTRSLSRSGGIWVAASLLLTLGMGASVTQAFLRSDRTIASARPAAAISSREAPPPRSEQRVIVDEPSVQVPSVPTQRAATRVAAYTPRATSVATPPSVRSARLRDELHERHEGDDSVGPDSGLVEEEPKASALAAAQPAAEASAAPAVASGLALLASVEPAAPPRAEAPPLNPSPGAAKPQLVEQPRKVASRLGHGQLSINPLAEPYRARMPRPLDRLEQSFATTVNICVNARGAVSGVTFMSAADTAVDREVSRAVSRWRYRPLLEAGRAVPFCYVLKYEIERQH